MSVTTMDTGAAVDRVSDALAPEQVDAASVRHLIVGGRSTWWVPYLTWLFTGAVTWRLGVWPLLAVGVALHSAIMLGLWWLWAAHDRAPDARPGAQWLARFRLISLALGVNWGVWFAVLAFDLPLVERIYAYSILAVLAVTAVQVLGIDLPSFRAYALPMILLPAPFVALPGETVAIALAIGGALYAGALDLLARDQRRLQLEQLRLSQANSRLTRESLREREDARAAREHLQVVLDNMDDGLMLFDADFRWEMINRQLMEFQRFTPEVAYPGASGHDIIRFQAQRGDFGPTDDLEKTVEERVAAMRKPGGNRYTRKTASGRWIDFHFKPLPGGRLLAMYRDITDLKAGEEQLTSVRAAMQLVLDNMGDGVALYGSNGDWRFYNSSYCRFLGLTEEVMATHPNIRDIVRFQALRGDFGPTGDLEALIEQRHSMFWASTRYVRDAADGVTLEIEARRLADGARLVTYRDITVLKRGEVQLAEALQAAENSAQTMRTLVANLPVGAALLDSKLCVRAWNDRSADLVGMPREFAYDGRPYKDFIRYAWESGDHSGADETFEEHYAARVAAIMRPGGLRYERHLPNGLDIDFQFRPLPGGGLLVTFTDVTEERRRETQLTRARAETEATLETMRTLVLNLPFGTSLYDPDLRLRVSNQFSADMIGMPRELTQPGRPYEDLLRYTWDRGDHSAGGETFEQHRDKRIAAIRQPGGLHYERQFPTGLTLDIHFRTLADGSVLLTLIDITERKKREVELAAARDAAREAQAAAEATRTTMQTVLDSMTDGVTFYEADGTLSYINAATMRFHRMSPELISRLHTLEDMARFQIERGDLGPVEDVEAEVRRRVALARAPEGQTYYRRTADGRYLEFRFLQVQGGATLSIHRDITELKNNEEALQRERQRLVDAIEALPNGFVLFDAEDRLVLCNMRFHQYYAEIADITVPGVHVREMLTEGAIRGAVSTGGKSVETWVDERMAMRRKPGTPIETRQPNGRWVVIGEQRTREGGLAGIYTDISELKRREEELERARDEAESANQSKSTFLATMSHEIRTPMNGVLGMMEILERQGIAENQRRTVATMRESAQALLRIIDDVLDFSRIEAGRLDLEEVEFSLSALVAGAVDTMRPQAGKKKLTLAVEVEPGSHDALLGDPTRVRQLLFNLLGNALKFTERGSVTVLASAVPLGGGDTEVKLVVRDTGIGMDAETVSRLFQPFAQADSSTTRRYGGSGLGLSIVRRLSQLMGGDVSVTSAPGLGSAFTVVLRIKAAPPESALRAMVEEQQHARVARTSVSDARVLVVDDHPVNREVLAQQLLLLGIASDSAEDGAEALAAWAPGRYAAILADMHMPVMDGFEMTRRLRALEIAEGHVRTPIVAVTANAMAGEAERCLAAGMDAFLAKPVSIEQLRTTLERWLPMDDAPETEDEQTDEAEAFDPSVMGRLFGKDRKSIARVLGTFIDSVGEIEREIAAAASEGDTAALAAAAHKLKGAARTAGAMPLGDIAASLEQAARGGDLERCRTALGPLAAARRRTLASIEAWRAEQ